MKPIPNFIDGTSEEVKPVGRTSSSALTSTFLYLIPLFIGIAINQSYLECVTNLNTI